MASAQPFSHPQATISAEEWEDPTATVRALLLGRYTMRSSHRTVADLPQPLAEASIEERTAQKRGSDTHLVAAPTKFGPNITVHAYNLVVVRNDVTKGLVQFGDNGEMVAGGTFVLEWPTGTVFIIGA